MPSSLAFCTSGVVPTARSGRTSCIAARSCSSEARYCTCVPRASSHCAVRLAPFGARAGGADIGHLGAGLDQQPRHQQFRAFVAGDGDARVDRVGVQRRADRRQRLRLGGVDLRRRDTSAAAPIASSQAAVPSTPDRAGADDRPAGGARTRGSTRCRTDAPRRRPRSRARHTGRAIRARQLRRDGQAHRRQQRADARPDRPGTARRSARRCGVARSAWRGRCTGPCSASRRA